MPRNAESLMAGSDDRDPSHTHVNMTRLLASCDKLAAGGLYERVERRRFETYLAALQRMWHELAAQGEQREWATAPSEVRANAASETQLSEYRRRIERLAELLDGDKMLSGAGSALALVQAQCNGSLSREQANAELMMRLHATSRMQTALRNQLLGPGPPPPAAATGAEVAACAPAADASCSSSAGGGSSSSNRSGAASLLGARGACSGRGGGGDSAAAESLSETLATERQKHEDALDEMTHMAAALRNRSLQARQALQQQCSTLDTTSAHVDTNHARLNQNSSKLRQQLRAMQSSTCYILLMLVMVFGLFMFTFLLMKIAPKAKPPV